MTLARPEWALLLQVMFPEVQQEVGLGRRQDVYQRACSIWLERQGIPFVVRPVRQLLLGSMVVAEVAPDLVIWDTIAVCLKAVPRSLTNADRGQLLECLKCCGLSCGVLVNLGLDSIQQQSLVLPQQVPRYAANWNYWHNRIDGRSREVGLAVSEVLRTIFDVHQTGYGSPICQRLLECGLQQQGLRYKVRPPSKAYFRGVEVDDGPLDCLLVEEQIVLAFTAQLPSPYRCINRSLSYMRSLGREWGIAVNFGHCQMDVLGLRRG